MRYEQPLYLCSPASYLGESVDPAAAAVSRGAIDAGVAGKYGYDQLTVSALAPVDMAVLAAEQTLGKAGVDAAELGGVLHAWTHFQGHEFWSPAHYVASRVGAKAAVPVGIQQMCNGGMAAIDLAGKQLVADPAAGKVLVTTADRFAPPSFDRWGGDLGVCYGDGATSVLVSRTPIGRCVRLHSVATVAAAELEQMHRGDLPFGDAPYSADRPLSPKLTKQQFHRSGASRNLSEVARTALTTAIDRAFENTPFTPADPRVRATALPRLSKNGLDDVYRGAITESCPAPIRNLGTGTGHLGAGDAVANLELLLDEGNLLPGDAVLLIGAGAGFTWSASLVEVV